jgi:peptidoglycan/LPS O-acetylase OafA/YrhL
MPQTLPTQPAVLRFVLGMLVLLAAYHAFRIVQEHAFPAAWPHIGSILLCAGIAFPHVPPGRAWSAKGRRGLFWTGGGVLLVAAMYCTLVLGR